ncbi:hypothetical protein [Massilia antarctica]|nr:hypothetical protein [Massilia sp. H27-R4]MCY0916327.1 hypothetical protein [Massilia sp. H27-R4]
MERTALVAEITAWFALAAWGSGGGDEKNLALTQPERTAVWAPR